MLKRVTSKLFRFKQELVRDFKPCAATSVYHENNEAQQPGELLQMTDHPKNSMRSFSLFQSPKYFSSTERSRIVFKSTSHPCSKSNTPRDTRWLFVFPRTRASSSHGRQNTSKVTHVYATWLSTPQREAKVIVF